MRVQAVPRSFVIRCYACKREVEITTRLWQVEAENELVDQRVIDYWGACPYCGADVLECKAQRSRPGKALAAHR